ncbi:hypothetical protein QCA50_008756 [Cerrena zonata]|uniref:Haloacid dehalogenase n=1 Tax=Cerrena zonata TaxID=2478898 RepID=A0AAW0GE77_9APHY
MADSLRNVEAFVFDVFGTVVDWRGSVSSALRELNPNLDEDWVAFTDEWRQGYYRTTRNIAGGGGGSTNVDVIHRELLNEMLKTERWTHLDDQWDDQHRKKLCLLWHNLNGWPDTTKGLYALKKKAIIGTLSNGSARLLLDMAKHADIPWDIIFSGDILNSYKPNPKMYLGAAERLSLTPDKVAMVAAHIYDLRAAAGHGMKTVYVRRPTEDVDQQDSVKPKSEGGEVDVVVSSFVELAELL